ncbi:MAG: ribonuclease Z [candidate division NC10 bacterium]|nr:ribonuclease Z [candidate division NC10 bacterium]
MASSFRSFLVNDVFGDPALYVGLPWERRALLFDLGDISSLSAGRLLKISDVFVSHAHLDHLIGFDHLLRVLLGRKKGLRMYGPPGFIDHMEGKLRGYTWNLVEGYSLSIEVREIRPDSILCAHFSCPEGFLRRDDPEVVPFSGLILAEARLRVRGTHLDHRIPCLAFALEEPAHLNVDKVRLEALGLSVGPWLMDLKRALRRGEADEYPIRIAWSCEGERRERIFPVETLRREVVRVSPGQKLAYVTDAVDSAENRERIVDLARGAELFYCEAAYPDRCRGPPSCGIPSVSEVPSLPGRAPLRSDGCVCRGPESRPSSDFPEIDGEFQWRVRGVTTGTSHSGLTVVSGSVVLSHLGGIEFIYGCYLIGVRDRTQRWRGEGTRRDHLGRR